MNERQKEIAKRELQNEKIVLNNLKDVYKTALDEIDDKIAKMLLRIMDDPTDTAAIYQKQYQEALKTQITAAIDNLNVSQYEHISDYLKNCYTDGFVSVFYDFAGQGVPLIIPVSQDEIIKAIQHNTKLTDPLYTALGYDLEKLKKTIRNELSRGIANGSVYDEIAKNISKYANLSMNKAYTITRTEGHRITNESKYNASIKAKKSGADIVKQWDSTLDGKTRTTHRQLDGQIKEIDEYFETGGQKAKYPSGFGVAREDVNCRCALLQRARWALDDEELQTLKDRAAFYGLDKTKDFEDFKKKYLKAVEKTAESGKISYKPVKTIEEAAQFLQSLGIATSYEYKNVNIDVANMINQEMTNIYNKFGDLHKLGVLNEIFIANGKNQFYAAYKRSAATLVLNKSNVSRKNSVLKMAQEAKEMKKLGFWSSGDFQHSVRHELGHAIDYAYIRDKGLINNPKADEITKLNMTVFADCGITKWSQTDEIHFNTAGEKLSYYGLMNDKEFVAEAIAEYMTGKPREIAEKVIEILLRK